MIQLVICLSFVPIVSNSHSPWYIRLKKAEMNRDVGTLSMDYDCLVRLEQKKDITNCDRTWEKGPIDV